MLVQESEMTIATFVRPFTLASLVAVSLSILGACSSIGPFGGGAASEADEARMLAALQASADAWNRGDLKGHLAIYDASVTVMTKAGPRPTIEAIEKSFGQAYFVDGRPKQHLRMESVTIRSLSERSALMTGRFILSGGGLPEQSGWFTLVWLRTAAGWRAVHDHTS
jgi:ketosteroid isomerase-like protein